MAAESEEQEAEEGEKKVETKLICFIIERDDVIGLKRIYFEKEKTLKELLNYFKASEAMPNDIVHRFRKYI